MKNTLISCIFLLTAAQMLSAQNLIRNGDFDKPLDAECRYDARPGVKKSGIFTENLTWNKCLKLEVAKYSADRNGRKYNAIVRIGGDAENNGFPVKPNTLYSYSLELKGTTGAVVSATEWNGPNYWKAMKRIKLIKGETGYKASEEWTTLRGTFQTSADATHAAIAVSIWGAERYKNLPPIGSYILIDKVNVEERADLLGNFKKPAAVPVSAPLKKVIVPGTDARGFAEYKTGMKAKADTIVLAEPGTRAVRLKIRCLEPEMNKLRHAVTDNGRDVWEDDCVEIFFAPVKNDRALSQFVIAAGGGRWMGRGTDQAVEDYGRWSARVSMEKDAWTIEAEIPYALLGWDGKIAPGSVIPFNVARNRTPVREASSLAFANGSFHNVKQFAVLLLDTPEACFQALRKKRLAEAEQGAPDSLKRKIVEWKRDSDPAEMLRKSEQFQQELRSAKLVRGEKLGKEVKYSLDDDHVTKILQCGLAHVDEERQ